MQHNLLHTAAELLTAQPVDQRPHYVVQLLLGCSSLSWCCHDTFGCQGEMQCAVLYAVLCAVLRCTALRWVAVQLWFMVCGLLQP